MTVRNSSRGFLHVPLRIQAMCLDQPKDIVRAMADFRRLPAETRSAVRNARTPNLAENVLTPPFSKDLQIPAGIHLHWLLPDALTQGEQMEAHTRFPHVPNRWLVLRSGGGKPERQWVVESDYLYPEGYGEEIPNDGDAPVNIQVLPDPSPNKGYRYRFLGRALTLADWRSAQGAPGDEYLPALTAVGAETEVPILDTVRAAFASFYPNCRGVFGFHDAELKTASPPSGLRYDVMGWYSQVGHDCLTPLLTEATSPEELKRLLEERLEWSLDSSATSPHASLFHARLTFTPGARAARDVVGELSTPTLAMGRTETEALAAHLAHRHAPQTNDEDRAKRELMEQQLEALQLTDRLEGHTLDLEAILQEARHERGFAAHSGGIRWTIQPETDTSTELFSTFRMGRKPRATRTPPTSWMGMLDALNVLQAEYQRATDELKDLRERMFMRWYSLLPSKGTNLNFFKDYVAPVRRRLTSMGRMVLEETAQRSAFRARLEPSAFEVVSSLSTHHATYVRVINEGKPFNTNSGSSYETWAVEFEHCCGFKLDATHTVKVVERDKSWEVHNLGVVYPVSARESGLFLEIPPAESSIAVRFSKALETVRDAIHAYNATEEGRDARYVLRAAPETPYWEPADPVVLFTGEAAAADLWNAQSTEAELLPCAFADLSLDLQSLPQATLTAMQGYLNGLLADTGQMWKEGPWTPFLMHWSLHVAPCGRDENGDFDPGLLLEHYDLGIQGIDLTLKPGHEQYFSETDDVYQGTSLLSASASLEVKDRILYWLEDAILERFYEENDVPSEDRVKGYLEEHFTEIHDWYLKQNPGAGVEDPVFTALWSYDELLKTPCLAQSIGNFHQVLLLREPTLQLKISDPTALRNSLHFFITETTRDAMGEEMQRRPLALDRFNPFRAGAMSLTGLWLVDTFGQVLEVMKPGAPREVKVIAPTDQTPTNPLHQLLLPPRFSQPARVRFDWIPAESSGGRRSNEHPGTSPVCGFLLVNNLDGALAVYDAKGRALGTVDRGGTWRTAPETGTRTRMDSRGLPQFHDAALQQVVHHVLEQGPDFLRAFLSTQRTALDTIDPEAYAENPSRALLVDRPVAVVRASLTLEFRGPPAFDPSVLTMGAAGTVTSRDVEKIKVPVRLGEYKQLNDGLVGFWWENPDGSWMDGVFHSPQERAVSHPKIRTYHHGLEVMLPLRTLADPAQHFTFLLDPRAQVHATTGVLPSPQLRIHPDHYSRALTDMEVSFLTAPFLSDKGALRLPVPVEPGHVWSWVTQEPGGAWAQTHELEPPNPRAAFSAPQELREGWLILRRSDHSES
ncbi:hypothetical protein [Vitiosangium sp. GDMCC 1.1324]|uniref:hypothetical protein n=1 Tax=Vitiosangium sp. (strain GDMCC 1.1324) TaxID=2138576 RepID=UPI000D389CC4|nr:hypothetical protein [Vitiosangium sp. GDMCC 1.1324]PTL81146.1 hypothetical protein DAT35_23770 [Vitiosangium sp. GDMCC 1.1324]